LRGLTGWGRNAAATFAANVGEYLQEEGRDLVTRTEMDEFLREVDEQRETADRLEARVAQLTRPSKR
jgi:ubiquinone biosynthesis protein UbiJ